MEIPTVEGELFSSSETLFDASIDSIFQNHPHKSLSATGNEQRQHIYIDSLVLRIQSLEQDNVILLEELEKVSAQLSDEVNARKIQENLMKNLQKEIDESEQKVKMVQEQDKMQLTETNRQLEELKLKYQNARKEIEDSVLRNQSQAELAGKEILFMKSEIHRLEGLNMEMGEKHSLLQVKVARAYDERKEMEYLLEECNRRLRSSVAAETEHLLSSLKRGNSETYNTNLQKNESGDNVVLESSSRKNQLFKPYNKRIISNDEGYKVIENSREETNDLIHHLLTEDKESISSRLNVTTHTLCDDSLVSKYPDMNKDRMNFEGKIDPRSDENIQNKAQPDKPNNVPLMNYVQDDDQTTLCGENFPYVRKGANNLINKDMPEGNDRKQATLSQVHRISGEDTTKVFSVISAPFATDTTRQELSTFDAIDKKLTHVMEEKKALSEEHTKIDQRGRKNLKDRARSLQIEYRMKVLQAEILHLRQQLLKKPS